jgi:hypothetical protein
MRRAAIIAVAAPQCAPTGGIPDYCKKPPWDRIVPAERLAHRGSTVTAKSPGRTSTLEPIKTGVSHLLLDLRRPAQSRAVQCEGECDVFGRLPELFS